MDAGAMGVPIASVRFTARRSAAASRRPPSAAPICSQQRAPRRWLIGPPEDRNHCGIAINFGSSSTLPVPAKAWVTAPQFCGVKSFTRRDPRPRRSLLLGLGIRRTRRRGSRRPSNVAQFRLQRHLPRVPLISCFRPQDCGAVSRCSARPDQVPTIARLSRFNNKFCLQRDRSTT